MPVTVREQISTPSGIDDLATAKKAPAIKTAALQSTLAKALPGLLRRGDVVQTSAGEHWRVCVPVDELWPNGPKLVAARQEFLQSQLAIAREAIEPNTVIQADFPALIAALPDRFVALDLETCGLAGAALFLVGMLRQSGGVPIVELLVARTYAEEAAVLKSFWQIMATHDVMITFNGKTFDWPMVLERSVRHRLRPSSTPTIKHIDVLHHARRRWRKHLPNCRLQTLEWHVCRRRRADDIPGHRIPAVYAEYVRTGFERDMDTVLYHNALDLVTLFDLALRLAA
jgi:uncharacterized protein YprB with RNaseH-like and TPR domain